MENKASKTLLTLALYKDLLLAHQKVPLVIFK